MVRLFVVFAACGPAVLFGLAWRLLNAELPFVGQGVTHYGVVSLVGILFYCWLISITKECSSFDALLPQAKKCCWAFVVMLMAVPGGRIAFSLLPPWDNASGGVIGTLIAFALLEKHFTPERKRFEQHRGTVMLAPSQADTELERLPAGSEPRIRWLGREIPGEVAKGNILAVGAIGTGKTRLHRELMRSIVPHITPELDRRMLVYDVKSDLLGELEDMKPQCEVLVLNPFDRRGVAWDIAADVRTPQEARQFADAFIPPAKGDDKKFFPDAAKNLVGGAINELNERCPGGWDLRDLVKIAPSKDRLRKLLCRTDLPDQYFSPQDTFDNVRNTIANVMVELEPVAALYKHAPRKISLRQWVRSGGSILILGGKENLQASLETLNRIAFKIISTEFLSQPESPNRSRLWFFCDELKTAGRLDNLPALLNARSKGVRCVLGFQDQEGIIDAYGSKERAMEIISRCTTISILKTTSTDTAKWASDRTGDVERFEYLDTQTKDGTNVGEHLTKREAVLPSEFLNLPDFRGDTITGIHLVRGLTGIFRKDVKACFPAPNGVKDFDPRDEQEQRLAPWTVEDERRLGLADDDDNDTTAGPVSAGPQPDEPDLSSLGRVSFGQ